jgi:superfamily I DNA/RNA helicase
LRDFSPAGAANREWPSFCDPHARAARKASRLASADRRVRRWYEPRLEALHGDAHARAGDLEQLEQIAGGFDSRERFLSEVTLDPPSATGAEAGPPLLDEDYLILSTIHSAKGQEWDAVFVLNVVDGCIPSDMATGTPEEIEEERRLLYVAMTRAKSTLASDAAAALLRAPTAPLRRPPRHRAAQPLHSRQHPRPLRARDRARSRATDRRRRCGNRQRKHRRRRQTPRALERLTVGYRLSSTILSI